MTATRHDPVSVEIHRKALDNITAEMAITLTRTSGSPVVYEVQDFATCLMDAAGEHLSMSATVLFHSASSLIGTQALIAAAAAEGEVRPGDGWIVNDSFEAGAMHQGDVAIIMPQFYEGKHVGWAFSNVHVADIGGMSSPATRPAPSRSSTKVCVSARPRSSSMGSSTLAGSAFSRRTCVSPTSFSTTFGA
jgi:N-methylhydantoinase B